MPKRDIKELIENNLDKIEQWTQNGLTMKQIAGNLGISVRTLHRHKADDNSHLRQTIKKGRETAVEELENSMYASATGYEKKIKKYQKVKRCKYIDGKKDEEWEEMVEYEETVYFPPDTTAGIFLLKNWGKYMNEPATVEIRKKEAELKEKKINAEIW